MHIKEVVLARRFNQQVDNHKPHYPYADTQHSNAQYIPQESKPKHTGKIIVILLIVLLAITFGMYTVFKQQSAKPVREYNVEEIKIEEPGPIDETLTLDSGVSIYAPVDFKDSDECKHLEDCISTLVDKGYAAGVYCYDMSTGYKLSYNADESIYGASAIKEIGRAHV